MICSKHHTSHNNTSKNNIKLCSDIDNKITKQSPTIVEHYIYQSVNLKQMTDKIFKEFRKTL